MAVIINELEIVIDPDAGAQKAAAQGGGAQGGAQAAGGKTADAAKPPLEPQDVLTVFDRDVRNCLRVMAH